MNLLSIRSAFRAALIAVPSLPAVAWQNREFNPTIGTPYLREFLLPINSQMTSLGGAGVADGFARDDGIYQITLCYPADDDTGAAETLAKTLCATFKPGSTLAMDTGRSLLVTQARVERPMQEPGWFVLPVSVHFHLHRPND